MTFYWGIVKWGLDKITALVASFFLNIAIGFWQVLNSFIRPAVITQYSHSQIAFIINGSGDNLSQGFVEQIKGALLDSVGIIQENNIISSIVTVSTIIAVAAVFIKYGYVILKTYFINVEGQTAAPTLDFFKRVLYVLIMCIVAPYIMFNGLFFASFVGLKVGTTAIDNVSNARKAQALFEVFSDQDEFNDFYITSPGFDLKADTYCDTDALKKDSESIGISSDSNTYKNLQAGMIQPGKFQVNIGGTTYDAYNVICLDSLNLADEEQSVFKNRFGAGTGFERPMQWLIDTGANNLYTFPFGGLKAFSHVLSAIITIVAGFGIAFMTALRVVDLISALVMMWFYAQAYVSEMQSNAISRFIQKIASIWITQFYTITMYGLYLSNSSNSSSGTLVGLALNLALVSMMLKPPAALQDLLTPSGAANTTLGAAKRVRGLFS